MLRKARPVLVVPSKCDVYAVRTAEQQDCWVQQQLRKHLDLAKVQLQDSVRK